MPYGQRGALSDYLLTIYDIDTLLHLLYAASCEVVDYGCRLYVEFSGRGFGGLVTAGEAQCYCCCSLL